MDKQKSIKDFQNFKRQIASLLRDFQRNKQWADYSHWLHRLYEQIVNRKFSQLPQQITLCKRLAQCLNPALPAGVHTTVLKIYEIAFKNFSNKTQLIPLLGLGLFPFFEHSNSVNRNTLLKIFDDYLINEPQFIQMIVGFTNAILTGLNENNQDQSKKIYSICEKISKNYGNIWMDGAVWINILKSPKVRLAGFKYFTKIFKSRDKLLLNPIEENKIQQQIPVIFQNKIMGLINEQQKILLLSIYSFKGKPDNHTYRFPNFSTLVLNTLCVCIQVGAEIMLKRSALDLLIMYLKLGNKNFGQVQGVILMEKLLFLLQLKEYNLTNRVYKYLFDQPNSQGQFFIDFEKKQYELQILKKAINNLLNTKNGYHYQGVLLIINILITDHPILAEFLLKTSSFQIIIFIKHHQLSQNISKDKSPTKAIQDFYLTVITKYKQIFLNSIIDRIKIFQKKTVQEQSFIDFKEIEIIIDALDFYFHRLQNLTILNWKPKRKGSATEGKVYEESQDSYKQYQQYHLIRSIVIRELIMFLFSSSCKNEAISASALDLCNQLYYELSSLQFQAESITQTEVQMIQQLLSQQAKSNRKSIYSKLLTLLPTPKKQYLLPYIEDSSLSIVCINIILGRNKLQSVEGSNKKTSHKQSIKMSSLSDNLILHKDEQVRLFKAIFKLLNCHLFESRALQFIERFQYFYRQTFDKYIDEVQPSQWLIYWKKKDGNVYGGIIRMIQNLNSKNSYYQHLSRKWINQSQGIISKIIDPLFLLMKNQKRIRKLSSFEDESSNLSKQWNFMEHTKIFELIKTIFISTTNKFNKFFYLQNDKYLNPLIVFIFKCLQLEDYQIKSQSLDMINFLLDQTQQLDQKFNMIQLTLSNILNILQTTIDNKTKIRQTILLKQSFQQAQKNNIELLSMNNLQIQLLEYIEKVIVKFKDLIDNNFAKKGSLIVTIKDSKIYEIILKGKITTQTPYIKTLYIETCKSLIQMVVKVDTTKTQVTSFMAKILDKLFEMLRNTDMNKIQEIIKGRNDNSNIKQSFKQNKSLVDNQDNDFALLIEKQSIAQEQIKRNLNLQERYRQIIQLWNSIKFYLQFSINNELKQLPISNLLSLILYSFTFSYLKYTNAGSKVHNAKLQALQEQINNVTGLKKQVLQIFQILWKKQNKQILDLLIQKGDPSILVHSSLNPSKVIEAFIKTSTFKQIIRYFKTTKFNLPRNTLHYNLDILIKENKIFYFLYVYLLYANVKTLKNQPISNFFNGIIEFLKTMSITTHVQTKLWFLQVLELISRRIVNTRQLNVQNWGKIKSQLQDQTKNVLDEIVAVIVKSKQFTQKIQIKTGLFNLFNKEEKENSFYDFIKIFPPSIHEIFENYERVLKKRSTKMINQTNRMKQKANNLQQPRSRLNQFIYRQDNIDQIRESKIAEQICYKYTHHNEIQYIKYISFCCLKTLIRINNELVINIYEKDKSKTSVVVRQILMNILPLCENHEPENQMFNQLIAQFLHVVLDNAQLRQDILRSLRRNILDVFMVNDFFKCTQKTLAHWRAIIDYCSQTQDLLSQLLSKEGLLEGIFTKKAESMRQKIKNFERVCFIIYAGKIDKYENRLRVVLESVSDVMKQQNPSPAMLILILFCIRILFIRLSAISLNKLFRSVWPSLITLLITIFKKDRASKNINLQLSALKVIELIHALQIEEFMFHKWIFVFDYFGLKIDPMGDIQDNMKSGQILTPFSFKPYLNNILPNSRFKCKFIPDRPEIEDNSVAERHLIVKKTNIQDEQQLKECVLLLMQYMMDLNQIRCQVSKEDIENLIEDDFISLDNYIFKMK